MKLKRKLNTSQDPMHMRNLLIQRFAEAGIPLMWAQTIQQFDRRLRIGRDTPPFMMDVRLRATKHRAQEHIIIHYGNGTAVNVLDVDTQKQQVVLRVHEPKAKVEWDYWDANLRKRFKQGEVIQESKRSILVGMDERHLFVCPLERNASSVREAHHYLQPAAVRSTSDKQRKRSQRQGEWFFLPVTDAEVLLAINEMVWLTGPQRRVPVDLAAGARPHVVDERVALGDATYVRGCVRHPDHHVLKLSGWHRVHINTEDRDARIEGMSWVD